MSKELFREGDDAVTRALKAFNGGLIDLPDATNKRGYVTRFWPERSMAAVLNEVCAPLDREISDLREKLASAYILASGKTVHASDCATSQAPAMEPGPCNCAMLAARQTGGAA